MKGKITIQYIRDYARFGGDSDGVERTGVIRQLEDSVEVWPSISRLLGDLRLVKNGLASEEYGERVERMLKEYCDSGETIAEMRKMAEKGFG